MEKNKNNSKTETKKGSGGFLGGLVLILIGILLLSSNEGRTVSMQSAINEGLNTYKDVPSEKINPKNDGLLVVTNGKLNLSNSEELKDSKFGIGVNAAKMKRNVEMYEWQEECTTDDDDKQSCSYSKVWSDKLIDSSEFVKSEYKNPESFNIEAEEYKKEGITVGEYNFPERLLDQLSYDKKLNNEKLTELYKTEVDGFKIKNNYLVNSQNLDDAQIGDIRISYEYASDGEVTLLGVQNGNTLTAFTGKKGKTIFTIKRGSYTGRELLLGMSKSNKNTKWLLRVLGTLIVILGVGSLFNPLQYLTDKVPVLRNIVNISSNLLSTFIGLAISLTVIAIAWFRYRPILSIVLIAISICLLLLLKLSKKKTPEDAVSKKQTSEKANKSNKKKSDKKQKN